MTESIEQLTPEELFNTHMHIAKATVYKVFKDPRGIAKKYNIELDDIFQYAYEGLWRASLKYRADKGQRKFVNYAITLIRWSIFLRLNRENNIIAGTTDEANEFRKNAKVMSLDNSLKTDSEDCYSYHDIIGSDYSIEEDVMDNLLEQMINEKFPKRTLFALKRRVQGATLKTIGDELGISRELVRLDLEKVKKKLKEVV